MADQVPISGEYCTLTVEEVEVAATRTFSLAVDRASFGNFVARDTSSGEQTLLLTSGRQWILTA